ncbi:MAG: hypothetical protein KAS32_11730 [Candidatus Peribacteraceae bacterium]|nr:hypothetical protein [Candidatus Peribacteraceae bacterium]
MYVKIIVSETDRKNGCLPSSGSNGCSVVPSSIKVIECDMVDYSKYSVKNVGEFAETLKYKNHTIISSESGLPETPFEFLYLVIKPKANNPDTWVCYAAADCSLFIMNESGKTIDFIRCGKPGKLVFSFNNK